MGFGKNLQKRILEELEPIDPRFYDKYISGKNIFILLKTKEQGIFEKYKYCGSNIYSYQGLVEINGN